MTPEEKQAWIDNASYEDLLRKWRFEKLGSEWFNMESLGTETVGSYFELVMARKKNELTPEEQVATSKRIGWGQDWE